MIKRKEKTEITECPKCGCKSFMSTSEGVICKECKYLVSTFAPLPGQENK